MRPWRVCGVNFDHMHMGDLLREAHEHANAEIVGVCDKTPSRMAKAIENFSIPKDRVFADARACVEATKPDLMILCPATADHASAVEEVAEGEFVGVAKLGVGFETSQEGFQQRRVGPCFCEICAQVLFELFQVVAVAFEQNPGGGVDALAIAFVEGAGAVHKDDDFAVVGDDAGNRGCEFD